MDIENNRLLQGTFWAKACRFAPNTRAILQSARAPSQSRFDHCASKLRHCLAHSSPEFRMSTGRLLALLSIQSDDESMTSHSCGWKHTFEIG